MAAFPHIVVALAGSVVLVWLYPKVRHIFKGEYPESPLMQWLKRRNRPTTVLGKNDEDVL